MIAKRRLGKTDLEVTPIGLGCWQFGGGQGASMIGNFWGEVSQQTVNEIVQASLDRGVSWFDTAEIYGRGRSEQALAKGLQAAGKQPGEVEVATKWFPLMRTASSIRATIDERLRMLAPYPIDLHQVHQWFSFSSAAAEMDAMVSLVKEKKIRAVGASNFPARMMRAAHQALQKHGLSLASNQMPYSLLDRRIEKNGVMAAAKELGISIIAYSPLAQGILSGKFHDDPNLIRASAGPRKFMPAFRKSGMEKSRPVVEALKQIAQAHGSSPAQVALAWVLQFHGDAVVAIPGATKRSHVDVNVGAMSLKLSAAELARLDEVSRRFL